MDNLTPEQRRKNMQSIRSSGTVPEILFAKELRKLKIPFSHNVKHLLGKPDFVLKNKKVAVFIDSDFWHGHPKRFKMPKTNKRYWKIKIENNKKRDAFVNRELKRTGWKVIRFWEHSVKLSSSKCIKMLKMKL